MGIVISNTYFHLRYTLPVKRCNLWWKAPKAPKERRTPWVMWTPSGSLRPCVRTTYWVRGRPGFSSGTPRCHPATLAVSWTGTRPSTPRSAWLTAYVDPQQHSQWKFTSYVLPLKKNNNKTVKLLLQENKKLAILICVLPLSGLDASKTIYQKCQRCAM